MDLTWWVNRPDFDASSWWMEDGCDQINAADSRLVEGERPNRTMIYRPGPIYWEVLRRHPDMPALMEAACGPDGSELPHGALLERLDLVDDRCRGIAFYLIQLFRWPWIKLRDDVPKRFEHYLPYFALATAGKEPARIRFPNAAIDLRRESATELGELARFGRFVKEVDSGMLDSLIHDAGSQVAPRRGEPRERIVLLDRLEAELSRFGLDLSIFAIQSASANGTISESIRRALDRHRPEVRRSPSRLQPDILKHFHKLDKDGEINASAKRKLNEWFSQFSFRGMIESLSKEDRG